MGRTVGKWRKWVNLTLLNLSQSLFETKPSYRLRSQPFQSRYLDLIGTVFRAKKWGRKEEGEAGGWRKWGRKQSSREFSTLLSWFKCNPAQLYSNWISLSESWLGRFFKTCNRGSYHLGGPIFILVCTVTNEKKLFSSIFPNSRFFWIILDFFHAAHINFQGCQPQQWPRFWTMV